MTLLMINPISLHEDSLLEILERFSKAASLCVSVTEVMPLQYSLKDISAPLSDMEITQTDLMRSEYNKETAQRSQYISL